MHEPDKEPEARLIGNDKFSAQKVANASLICGGLTIIGMILAFASGKATFLGLAIVGVVLAIIAIKMGESKNDQRARTTAVIAILLNAVLFMLLLTIFLFFREAAMMAA